MSNEPFSQRHGLAPQAIPIAIRHEAPSWFRDFLVTAAQDSGIDINDLREILCARLLESPNTRYNWSPGNVECEVRGLLENAEWFHVYDFCEDIAENLRQKYQALDTFSMKVNEALIRKGVGWRLIGGLIEIRGDESFEACVRGAVAIAESTGRTTTSQELHQALSDLSKRPAPDVTGAIQHAGAALECVARDVTGDPKATLGDIIKKFPNSFPSPLDEVVKKIWGFNSEHGRHLREGGEPHFDEAELVVGLSGTIATYLMRKNPR
jgi:AbiJ N-terminal domain 4